MEIPAEGQQPSDSGGSGLLKEEPNTSVSNPE